MKTLYETIIQSRFPRLKIDESIMDTDTTRAENIKDFAANQIADFLKLDTGAHEDDCKYTIKDGKIYIESAKNRICTFRLYDMDDNIYLISDRFDKNLKIPAKLMNNCAFFNNVTLHLTMDHPDILSNCNNCTIYFIPQKKEKLAGSVDVALNKTQGNVISISGAPTNQKYLYDFSCLTDADFKTSRVVLGGSAILNSFHNLRAKSLVLFRGSKWDKNDADMLDIEGSMIEGDIINLYNARKIDKFLENNDIESLGMVSTFVQYNMWLVKDKNNSSYKVKFLGADSKRVPKING